MRRFNLLVVLVLGVLFGSLPVWSQGAVRIASNAPDAQLFVDGQPQAWEPGQLVAVAPGLVPLVLIDGEVDTWDARSITVTLQVASGDTLDVRLDLPVRYRIESMPYGADVVHVAVDGARTRLGPTPLTLDRVAPFEGMLVVSKEGYAEQELRPGTALTNEQSVLLRPLRAEDGAEVVGLPGREANGWIDVAAGALALAGAATAVYFKLRADEVDDRYRDPFSDERGDPALRDEAQRLDTYSAVGLGGMQVGLGIIAVRLVLR